MALKPVDEEKIFVQSRVFTALAEVPPGTVVTYGQLARLAGLPNGARQVGRILGNLPRDTQLPWHRVINAAGKISLGQESPGFKNRKPAFSERV